MWTQQATERATLDAPSRPGIEREDTDEPISRVPRVAQECDWARRCRRVGSSSCVVIHRVRDTHGCIVGPVDAQRLRSVRQCRGSTCKRSTKATRTQRKTEVPCARAESRRRSSGLSSGAVLRTSVAHAASPATVACMTHVVCTHVSPASGKWNGCRSACSSTAGGSMGCVVSHRVVGSPPRDD